MLMPDALLVEECSFQPLRHLLAAPVPAVPITNQITIVNAPAAEVPVIVLPVMEWAGISSTGTAELLAVHAGEPGIVVFVMGLEGLEFSNCVNRA
jgi:hypothetical protein